MCHHLEFWQGKLFESFDLSLVAGTLVLLLLIKSNFLLIALTVKFNHDILFIEVKGNIRLTVSIKNMSQSGKPISLFWQHHFNHHHHHHYHNDVQRIFLRRFYLQVKFCMYIYPPDFCHNHHFNCHFRCFVISHNWAQFVSLGEEALADSILHLIGLIFYLTEFKSKF